MLTEKLCVARTAAGFRAGLIVRTTNSFTIERSKVVQSTLFIPTLDTRTKFVLMTI